MKTIIEFKILLFSIPLLMDDSSLFFFILRRIEYKVSYPKHSKGKSVLQGVPLFVTSSTNNNLNKVTWI